MKARPSAPARGIFHRRHRWSSPSTRRSSRADRRVAVFHGRAGAAGRRRRAPLVCRARTEKRVKRPRATPFLWIAYPKSTSRKCRCKLNRDSGWTVLCDADGGLRASAGIKSLARGVSLVVSALSIAFHQPVRRWVAEDRIAVNSGPSHLTVGEVLIPSPRDPQAPTRAPSGLTAHPDPPHRNTESPHPRRAFRMTYQLVRRSVSCSLASKASSSNTLQLARASTHGPQSGPEMPLPSRQAPLP